MFVYLFYSLNLSIQKNVSLERVTQFGLGFKWGQEMSQQSSTSILTLDVCENELTWRTVKIIVYVLVFLTERATLWEKEAPSEREEQIEQYCQDVYCLDTCKYFE